MKMPSDQAIEVDRITRIAMEQDNRPARPCGTRCIRCKTTNTSPGGYCVEWNDPPDGIQIGDLVCVREAQLEQCGLDHRRRSLDQPGEERADAAGTGADQPPR
jgi:hypothetical protein